jgi:Ca-activated chloride channel homolog
MRSSGSVHVRACCLLIAVCSAICCAHAQSGQSYPMRVSVDEVVLTFHAADTQGLPIDDLKRSELDLFDNGKPPRRILIFDLLKNAPIRAGILLDTSSSMDQDMASSRALARRYAQELFEQPADQAFVMDFGYASHVQQDWTSSSAILSAAIQNIRSANANPLGGTALFDAVSRACYSQFGSVDHAGSGNFLLLFSDGVDNTSHVTLEEAVRMCQQSNTAIYAISPPPRSSGYSTGPATLQELASKTGGSVIASGRTGEIDSDLKAIESEARNQYRIVYNPANLVHDGSFHRIELHTPDRVATIRVRPGYYAPSR